MSTTTMKKILIIILLAFLSACVHRNHEQAFDTIKHDPVALRMFLSEMPKGAELHTHLSGIPYAEDYIKWAAADDACIEQASSRIVVGPCGNSSISATQAFSKSNIWNTSVDALSVRQNLRDNRMWGHDQFFATFSKFGVAKKNVGRLLAHASKQAYRDNVQYVEAMLSIYGPKWVSPWAEKVGWHGNPVVALRELRESGLFQDMDQAIRKLDETEFLKNKELRGGEGSDVLIRYINQIYRGADPAYVFAQMAWSFELVHRDPRVVALNLVGPEDSPIAVRDYELHMEMLDFFHKLYPDVPITLHAGELTGWLTTPEALSNHIRLAVIKGHAQRIGHGVDLAYEEKARDTLSLMKEKGVALECLLSSNDSILKVSGKNHPLNVYISSGVPVTLSSDDMGVARSTLTNEYVRAVVDQGLDYGQLKKAARNSLEYSFLKGESLWKKSDPYIMIGVCAGDFVPDSDCMSFLSNSEKAARQWELEKKLKSFEENYRVVH
ncbi:adenosine deaminase [Maridesulfovibrio ferrireducens]|uniref:adenosine deaminase n=1 Tax=Maridesulfovibrio ferrireducens TaxID=246191 RepID=A0A1G9LSC9_9BACT|nr:adenosine deaminase [Maridesulfovibrio ferrireducens]SDL64972.1 adenosine deaminase [Maridesulfovibrio ferrireducens]